MEQPISFLNPFGRRLSGVLSRPVPGRKIPVVVGCHGFGSGKTSAIPTDLARQLDQVGIASLRFDFTGHGDSEGEIETLTLSRGVDDLRAAVRSLEEYPWVDPSALGLFGHSFGGNVILWYVAGQDEAKALALLAPVSDYVKVKERKLGPAGIKDWKAKGYTLEETDHDTIRLSYAFYEDAQARNTYELAKQITADCLILHGAGDDTVPPEQSHALAEALGPRARLQLIPHANHAFERPGELANVLGEAAHFFRTRLLAPE